MAWPRVSNARPASGEILRRRNAPEPVAATGAETAVASPLVVDEAGIQLILTPFFGALDPVE